MLSLQFGEFSSTVNQLAHEAAASDKVSRVIERFGGPPARPIFHTDEVHEASKQRFMKKTQGKYSPTLAKSASDSGDLFPKVRFWWGWRFVSALPLRTGRHHTHSLCMHDA